MQRTLIEIKKELKDKFEVERGDTDDAITLLIFEFILIPPENSEESIRSIVMARTLNEAINVVHSRGGVIESINVLKKAETEVILCSNNKGIRLSNSGSLILKDHIIKSLL